MSIISIGNEVFNIKVEPKRPLIQGILNEKDFCCIVGAPKAGKSILAQQIAMAVAGGKFFMEDHEVYFNGDVVYYQAEGCKGEMSQRFVDMEKAVDTERAHIAHAYKAGLKLNSEKGLAEFTSAIDSSFFNPVLIVIDPMYMAFQGDLCSQTVTSQICDVIDHLRDRYGCAVVLTHHSSKETFDRHGNVIDRGDGAAYGSTFLKANADSLFMLRKEMESRVLTCDTQRSGKIIDKLEFDLIAPTQSPENPLLFVKKGIKTATTSRKIELLFKTENTPMSTKEIAEKLGVHPNGVMREVKKYIGKGLMERLREGKGIKYYWREGRNEC